MKVTAWYNYHYWWWDIQCWLYQNGDSFLGERGLPGRDFILEKTTVPPNSDYTLYCPFCDGWACKDSMIGRKRLGLHVANSHDTEVRFPKDVSPPPLRDI